MKNLAIPGQYSGILKMYDVLMGKFVVLVGIVGLVFGVGCSTAMKSTLLGAGVGIALVPSVVPSRCPGGASGHHLKFLCLSKKWHNSSSYQWYRPGDFS
jgi:hypothetical protein